MCGGAGNPAPPPAYLEAEFTMTGTSGARPGFGVWSSEEDLMTRTPLRLAPALIPAFVLALAAPAAAERLAGPPSGDNQKASVSQ